MKHLLGIALICTLAALCAPIASAGIQISVNIAPPPIAVFDQPACPGDGYIWTPGYYQYGDYGYYWVPGQWVRPPAPGLLWTPGYWNFDGGRYKWHAGYWGKTVGFYGGVNYGNGYFGSGFTGGRWIGNTFHHNTAVANVDVHNVHNVYEDRTVVKPVKTPNHAFSGRGGIQARPTKEEESAAREPHQGPTAEQVSHAQEAHNNHLAAHGEPRGKPGR
ncbi:MAG TPA: YXWGXW repeat-containing protein [Bryobacteraceae bacterium]|nr:YXWGXW repeat-containing protein [Bryobacteraceae bacterium]